MLRCPQEFARKHRKTSIFPHIQPPASSACNTICSLEDYKANVLIGIARLTSPNLPHSKIHVAKIVALGVSPIHAMHERLACGIGFKAEGSIPVATRLHLLGIEGLNPAHRRFHLVDHFGAIRTVIGQEVDQPHGARWADVQICQPLGRRGQ